jgi:hypothetical protein
MARRIFISYQHRDHGRAMGLNLMQYNKGINLQVSTRHLLNPVKSNDAGYIGAKIREQIKGTSTTVVLIGNGTHASEWVSKEIAWSLEKGNAILGMRLDPNAKVPDGLVEAGAEILDWNKPEDVHQFGDAIERAAAGARRASNMPTNSSSTCSR